MRQRLTTQKPSKLLPHLSDDAKELAEFVRKISAKTYNGVFINWNLSEVMEHTNPSNLFW